MKLQLSIIPILLFASSVFFNTAVAQSSQSLETTKKDPTSFSVGLGYQYAGLIGVQYNHVNNNSIYQASLGLVGFAAGYKHLVDAKQQHALGISVGAEQLSSEDGFIVLTYEYFPNTFYNEGWRVSIEAGARRYDQGFFSNSGVKTTTGVVSASIGYKF